MLFLQFIYQSTVFMNFHCIEFSKLLLNWNLLATWMTTNHVYPLLDFKYLSTWETKTWSKYQRVTRFCFDNLLVTNSFQRVKEKWLKIYDCEFKKFLEDDNLNDFNHLRINCYFQAHESLQTNNKMTVITQGSVA